MKSVLPWVILSLLLGSGLIFQFLKSEKTGLKTAYVTNAKLYSEFILSKELDVKIKQVQSARKTILDSLNIQLSALKQKIEATTATEQEMQNFAQMRNEYGLKQQQFAEDNNLLVQRYQEQIYNQLNQYLKDYTQEHNYDYIFGATGDGSLMGAKEAHDITDDVLAYINNRYKGTGR